MKKWIGIFLAAVFLSGCTGADHTARVDVPTVLYQDPTDAKMGCLIEVPQIVDSEKEDALEINAELQALSQNMQDTYWDDEIMWCEMTAWPTESDRYISITLVLNEYPSYGTNGQIMSWVYDKYESTRMDLDDALAMAGTDMDSVKADIGRWCYENGYVMTETELTSFAFRMTGDDKPQFMAGAVMVEEAFADELDPWSSFFTWTDGSVEWTSSAPFDPAEVVGPFSQFLVCQTYEPMEGDAAIISEEEAMMLFEEIYEINKYLEAGMEMIFDGYTVEIDGETCICAELGTGTGGDFQVEAYYAATWGSAYILDPVTGDWTPVGFG